MSDFQDRTLTCAECSRQFTFSAGEQAFYKERSFSDPKRCPSCRAARRTGRHGHDQYGSSAGFSTAPSGARGGYADRPPREMHDIICTDCGQPAQVPFRPRNDRPVYCRDCYAKRRAF